MPEQTPNAPYDFGTGDESVTSRQASKHVHWIDDEEAILTICHRFVEHLKLFVHDLLNENFHERTHLRNCQRSLDELSTLTDCSQLHQALADTIELAHHHDKSQLLRQQTFIAHLIARTILST